MRQTDFVQCQLAHNYRQCLPFTTHPEHGLDITGGIFARNGIGFFLPHDAHQPAPAACGRATVQWAVPSPDPGWLPCLRYGDPHPAATADADSIAGRDCAAEQRGCCRSLSAIARPRAESTIPPAHWRHVADRIAQAVGWQSGRAAIAAVRQSGPECRSLRCRTYLAAGAFVSTKVVCSSFTTTL